MFCGPRESFLQRKVLDWAMGKKGIMGVLVRSVMSVYAGAEIRVRVYSELSEEFEVKVGMHLCCHLFFLQLW